MFMPRATLHLPLFSGHIRNSCRQPLCLLLPLPLLCRVVHRWILPFFILSKGTDGVSVENGNRGEGPVAHRICCYVLRVSAVYTVYSYKGNRELMLWSIERTGRWREREGRFLSFPPRSLRARYSIHGQGFHPLSCYHRN